MEEHLGDLFVELGIRVPLRIESALLRDDLS